MGNDEQYLVIKVSHLKELLGFQAKTLVGKACKRFELTNDIAYLKREIKELVYEAFRDTETLIDSYDKGLHLRQFKFISPKEGDPTK